LGLVKWFPRDDHGDETFLSMTSAALNPYKES
jgi:hypothetical protein